MISFTQPDESSVPEILCLIEITTLCEELYKGLVELTSIVTAETTHLKEHPAERTPAKLLKLAKTTGGAEALHAIYIDLRNILTVYSKTKQER